MKARLAAIAAVLTIGVAAPTTQAATPPKGHWPVYLNVRSQKACAANYLLHRKHLRPAKRGVIVNTLKRKQGCKFTYRSRAATRAAYWKLGWPRPYVKSKAGGKYGPRLHSVLLGRTFRPLDYRIRAAARKNAAAKKLATKAPTAGIALAVQYANYLERNAWRVHYTQSSWRWQVVTRHWPPLTYSIYGDCSSTVTGIYRQAHLPDPNQLGWGGGYTGTLAQHGRVVWRVGQSLSLLKPGDLVFYGRYPFHHVVMYKGGGRVSSHGSARGPYDVPVLYRLDAYYARRYVG